MQQIREIVRGQAQTKAAEAGDKWHLDEVFLNINGVQHYLWRAVDQHGAVIDILVQPKRDRFAAMRFFRKLLNRTRRHPRAIITDRFTKLWGSQPSRTSSRSAPTISLPQ